MSRYLVFWFVFCILFLVGCRTFETASNYYDACLSDVECVNRMQLSGNIAGESARFAADSTGFSSVVGFVVGNTVSLIVGVYLLIE